MKPTEQPPMPPFKINWGDVYRYLFSDNRDVGGLYWENLQTIAGEKDKDYLETVFEGGRSLQVNEQGMLDRVESLTRSLFKDSEKMTKQFRAEYEKLPKDNDSRGKIHENQLDRTLFLYDHLKFLHELDKEEKLYALKEDIGIDEEIQKANLVPKRVIKFLGKTRKEILNITGISREHSPVDDARWKDFSKARDEMLNGMRNHPRYTDGSIDFRRNYFLESGSMDQAELDALNKMITEQEKLSNEQHKKHLASLNVMVEETNEKLLKKIEGNLDASDELYQYKVLHFLILSSVVLPVPLFGMLFEAVEPFLIGDLDITEFLSSCFSVDGPLGKLAFFTDVMEIDKLPKFTGDLVGNIANKAGNLVGLDLGDDLVNGPLDILNNILQNDITSPIMSSVGEGAAASPLSALILSAMVEVWSENIAKSADHWEKGRTILPDAIKDLEGKFLKQYRQQDRRMEGDITKFLGEEFDVRGNVFLAAQAAEWLQEKYKNSPESCKLFIENILKDQADKVLGILQDAEQGEEQKVFDDLTKHFYATSLIEKSASQVDTLFAVVVMLRKAEKGLGATKVGEVFKSEQSKEKQNSDIRNALIGIKYDDAKKGLEKDFSIDLAARHNKDFPEYTVEGKDGTTASMDKDTYVETWKKIISDKAKPSTSTKPRPNEKVATPLAANAAKTEMYL